MANTATVRAARANQAAKAKVKDQACPTCPKNPKKKCDAKLPEDEATKQVALTIYAESTTDAEEMSAIGSVMHNRVGHPGFSKAKDVIAVLKQRKQFVGYQGEKYKKGESGNINDKECKHLKDAIATAERLRNNGVPAQYKSYIAFHKAASAPPGGTKIGGTAFYSKPWWWK